VKAKLLIVHDGRHVWTRNGVEKKQSWCETSELSKWSYEIQCKKKNPLKYGSSADVSCLYSFSDCAKCVCLVDNFDLHRED